LLIFGYNTHSEHSNLGLVVLQNAQNLPLNNKNAPAAGALPQALLAKLYSLTVRKVNDWAI